MGNHLTNQLTTAVPPASLILQPERYVDQLNSQFSFVMKMGSTRFMKVVKIKPIVGDGEPCVLKIFVLLDPSLPIELYKNQINQLSLKLKHNTNCLPYAAVIVKDKAAFLIRQFVKHNLYDRLSTRPFLTVLEKRWIAFQLLQSLSFNSVGTICHGDIKMENVMVTSSNWSLLADFAPFKPTFLPFDNPAEFSYFFDTSRRRACYIAPERFSKKSAASEPDGLTSKRSRDIPVVSGSFIGSDVPGMELTMAMDIFSLGCVLVELFTDGNLAFTFSQMLLFKRGQYHPDTVLDLIPCVHLRELCAHMLQKDPQMRFSADRYLEWQRGRAFPDAFYHTLYPFFKRFVSKPLSYVDKQVAVVHAELGQVIDVLSECESANSKREQPVQLLLPMITSLSRGCVQITSRLKSLDCMLVLSSHLPTAMILDRLLPYVLKMCTDNFARVRSCAVCSMANILLNVRLSELRSSDRTIFNVYIFPPLEILSRDSSSAVRMELAEWLSTFADLALKFLKNSSNQESAPSGSSAVIDYDAQTYRHSRFDGDVSIIREHVQTIAQVLLCDSENAVKRCLFNRDIAAFCDALGKIRVSDTLLSHMITFLNDKMDWQLRATFGDTVPELATFVGQSCATSLPPLLQQSLSDSEEMVIVRSLNCMRRLVKVGVLSKRILFTLMVDAIPFVAHPGSWVRIASCSFIYTCANVGLSLADTHCKLLPLLQPYLKQPLIQLQNPSLLYRALNQPIPRGVFELLIQSPWISQLLVALKERKMSQMLSNRHISPGSVLGSHGVVPLIDMTSLNNRLSNQPLVPLQSATNAQVQQLFNKLQSRGMTLDVEHRLLNLETALIKMQRHYEASMSLQSPPASPSGMRTGSGSVQLMYLEPQQRMVKIFHRDQYYQVGRDRTSSNTVSARGISPFPMNSEWHKMFGVKQPQAPPVDAATVSDPDSPVKVLSTPDIEHAIEATDVDSDVHQQSTSTMSGSDAHTAETGSTVDTETEIVETTDIRVQSKIKVKSDCAEKFDKLMEAKEAEYNQYSKKLIDRSRLKPPPANENGFKPEGVLLCLNQEHSAATRLSVHSNGDLLVSASEDGSVRLWEMAKLNGSTSSLVGHSSDTYVEKGARMNSVQFSSADDLFFVASSLGDIIVAKSIRKGGKIKITERLPLDAEMDGDPLYLATPSEGNPSLVMCGTHHGSLLGWDVRSGTRQIFRLKCKPSDGLLTSMCVEQTSAHWLCAGMDTGHLVTFDLRFRLCINRSEKPLGGQQDDGGNSAICRLEACPHQRGCVWASVEGNGEICLVNLETSHRQLSLWSQKQIEPLCYEHCAGINSQAFCLDKSTGHGVISGDSEGDLRYWNLRNVKQSRVISAATSDLRKRAILFKSVILDDNVQVIRDVMGRMEPYHPEKGSNWAASLLGPSLQSHRDAITDVVMGVIRYDNLHSDHMIVTAARDGAIRAWK